MRSRTDAVGASCSGHVSRRHRDHALVSPRARTQAQAPRTALEDALPLLALSVLIGLVAGVRAFTAPLLVSWAARAGWLVLEGTPFAFFGHRWTCWALTLLALGELVRDKWTKASSRQSPPQLLIRILSGALSGGALSLLHGQLVRGMVAGSLGALAGTMAGAELRRRLVEAVGGTEMPVALLEDALALLGALAIVKELS